MDTPEAGEGHSLTDMLITGFLLTAAIWSRREADERYHFGYERAQNVAALVAALVRPTFFTVVLMEGTSQATGRGGRASTTLRMTANPSRVRDSIRRRPITILRMEQRGTQAAIRVVGMATTRQHLMT